MFLPFLVRGTPYNGQHMRFLRTVCGRSTALCSEKKAAPDAGCGFPGCRPPSSAIRSGGFAGTLSGIRRAECLSKPCTLHGFQARRLCQHAKKGCTPTRDAASRAVAPSFLCNPQRQRVRCEKAGLRHAFRDSARRMSLKTMRLARFPSASALRNAKKAAPRRGMRLPGLSFRRWRCFGCGSCGRRCRRGRPAPRACRTRRCARPG